MNHHASDAGRKVPFLVTLRDYAAQDPPERSVAAYIEHFGLEYPLTSVLVTSRLVGYDQARLDDRQFRCHRITAFTDEKAGEYVRKWFAQEREISRDEAERWAEAFMNESAAVPDLRANPLMLALMCILYRGEGSLPRDRAEVYERCAKLLFHKWDARRHIHVDLQAGHLLEPALGHLAHWLFTRDEAQSAVPERELVEEAVAVLLEYGFEPEVQARAAAEEFVDFCRGRMWVLSDVGTTAAGEPLYAFTHRTFMEYFAAAHLAYTSDTPEELARVLAPHVAADEWEVARCLRSVVPTPATVRALTGRVFDHLVAGEMDHGVSSGPLSTLLSHCAAWRGTRQCDGLRRGQQRPAHDGPGAGDATWPSSRAPGPAVGDLRRQLGQRDIPPDHPGHRRPRVLRRHREAHSPQHRPSFRRRRGGVLGPLPRPARSDGGDAAGV
jgi:hypothetical protein